MSSRRRLEAGGRLAEVGQHRDPAGGADRADGVLGPSPSRGRTPGAPWPMSRAKASSTLVA